MGSTEERVCFCYTEWIQLGPRCHVDFFCPEYQRTALQAIKWTIFPEGWSDPLYDDYCVWPGIQCDGTDITHLCVSHLFQLDSVNATIILFPGTMRGKDCQFTDPQFVCQSLFNHTVLWSCTAWVTISPTRFVYCTLW